MIWDDAKKRDVPLMRIRQTGSTSEHDTRQSVTEMIRRIKDEDEPEPERESIFAKPAARPPSGPREDDDELIDRFHKRADRYITIAKPHSITVDPIRLPGAFEFIQEAIDDAEANVIPEFTGDERVVLEIHGGDYEEDVTISSDRIDMIGVGKPRIYGTFTYNVATPGNFTGGKPDYMGIVFDGDTTYAVDLPLYADVNAGPGAPFVVPTFFNCWFRSKGTAFRTRGRVRVWSSEIWVDPDGAYGNLSVPAVWVYAGGHTYWSEFYDCRIAGAVDDRAPVPPVGFPNTGLAWRSTSKLAAADPVYFNYTDSGVMFRHCTIEGWGINECWQTYHDHCIGYGGHVTGALTGETYCYNLGDSSAGIRGRVFFDQTEIACRYLIWESDMTPGVPANTTDTYLRHFDHLSNGSSYLGSLIVPGASPLGGTGFTGATYGKMSVTWREYFNGPAAVELAMLLNCDSDIAHYAVNGFGFPSGGVMQAIFLNPYRDG